MLPEYEFIKRDLVRDGLWGDLGPAVAVLPVMALLSGGRGGRAYARTTTLRGYAGLTSGDLYMARKRLERLHLAEFRGARSGLWDFQFAPWIFSDHDRSVGIYFPGIIVNDGRWARLPRAAQSLVVALAAWTEPRACARHQHGILRWDHFAAAAGLDESTTQAAMGVLHAGGLASRVHRDSVEECGDLRGETIYQASDPEWYTLPQGLWSYPETDVEDHIERVFA